MVRSELSTTLALPKLQLNTSTYGVLPIGSATDAPSDGDGIPAVQGPLILDGEHFKDQQGRVLLLRGVNLGGDTKVPVTPDGKTHLEHGFYSTQHVSFVGRPFPIEEADE
jgi:hypothetical protein